MIIDIILVNYNTPNLTIECLNSLYMDTYKEIDTFIYVVDNCSSDSSLNIIERYISEKRWENWVTLLPTDKNGGFAYGNNRALDIILGKSSKPDYIWLLNPDTIVFPGACKSMVELMKNNSKAGIVGSRLISPEGKLQISAFNDHSILSEFIAAMRVGILDKLFKKWIVACPPKYDRSYSVDWVSGASMMVRRELFETIGLLDEKFFMYYEEVDYCMRARKCGWKIYYEPLSKVVHLEGASTNDSDHSISKRAKPSYWFESRHRFFLKNHGRATLFLADLLWLVGFSTWRIRRILQNKPDEDPTHLLRDFFRFSVFSKGFSG